MWPFKRKDKTKDSLEIFLDALKDANENVQNIGNAIFKKQYPTRKDYGRSESNPIFTSSLSETENYLNKLCTRDGEKFTWSSCGTIRATVGDYEDVGEDVYMLYWNGKAYTKLYFVLYVGDSKFPPADLYFYGDDTDWDIEREAFEKGLTAAQLREIRRMEEENNNIKLKAAQDFKQKVEQMAQPLKDKYPSVSLEEELQNRLFEVLARIDFDLLTAYEYLHKDSLHFKKHNNSSVCTKKYTKEICFNIMFQIEQAEFQLDDIHNTQSTSDMQKEATRLGITLNQLIEVRTMEKKNAQRKILMRGKELRAFAEQAVDVQTIFPNFDLNVEWKNPIFKEITERIDMLVAYELTHFYELYYSEQQVKTVSHQKTDSENYIFCRKCGTKLLADSAFCHKCGTEVIL